MTFTSRRIPGHSCIEQLIGQRGMGEVHRARDTRLNRDVVLKGIPAELADDSSRLERFEQVVAFLTSRLRTFSSSLRPCSRTRYRGTVMDMAPTRREPSLRSCWSRSRSEL